MYRIAIDSPLGEDQEKAITIAKKIAEFLSTMKIEGVDFVQYRLANDWDRGTKNYLDIDSNGHCSNKKFKIVFVEEKNNELD
jgi:hypothetical protein